MAYGVKYRLDFVDDKLNGKRIEILKDNYTGSVLPLVGTGDPISIQWDGNDDFYSPIIGSSCSINLFVTDDVSYDDFYTADEREYQVKVYYQNGGSYVLYWIGWLMVDQFREAVTSKPFEISLRAFDGLGSLNAYKMPISSTSTSKSLLWYIYNSLDNLDLGLDIYISNDIRKTSPEPNTYTIYDQAPNVITFQLMDDLNLPDAKKTLEQILKFTNARIFQSLGRWYIINNSSYSEQSVKTSSETTAEGGTVPTGIRASETSALQTTGEEDIKYFVYNSSGVYQSTNTTNVLYTVPDDMLPIGNNLTKEFLRPLKEVRITHDTSQMNDVNIIANPGFEHGQFRWTFTNASLNTEIFKQGVQSAEADQYQTNETGTTVAISQTSDQAQNTNRAVNLKINAYLSSTYTGDRSFRWQLKHDETGVPGGTDIYYWNESSESWTTTSTVNIQDIENNNQWIQFSYEIDSLPNPTGDLVLSLYHHYQQASSTPDPFILYDNITMDLERIDSNDRRTPIFSEIKDYVNIRERSTDYSGILEVKDLKLRNFKYGNVSGDYYRSRDDNSSFVKSIEEIVSQQIMNDYRSFVVRYEGYLYNQGTLVPLSLHNKVWIDFGTGVLQEPVSCYIDSMTYNVKRNVFTVVMHIPNQDDDVTSDFKSKF